MCGVIVFGDFIICLTSSYSLHDARRGSVFRGAVIMVHWQWIVTEWHKRGKPIDITTLLLRKWSSFMIIIVSCWLKRAFSTYAFTWWATKYSVESSPNEQSLFAGLGPGPTASNHPRRCTLHRMLRGWFGIL